MTKFSFRERIFPITQRFGWLKQHLLPLASLLVLSGVTYLSVFDPVISADDWDLYRKYLFGQEILVNWASRRPLEELGIKILLAVLGANLRALFLATVLTIFITAVAAYFLSRRLFPRCPAAAFPVAALFLIYPVDTTRMWFTQVDHWMIFAGVLLAILWMWDYAQGGRVWKLVGALLLILLALGIYEAPYGLAAAGAVLIALFLPKVPLRRRLFLSAPLWLGVFYLFWRVAIRPRMLGVQDPYLSGVDYSLLGVAQGLSKTFPVFVQAWAAPFTFILPGITTAKLLAILCAASVCCALLVLALVRSAREENEKPLSGREKIRESLDFLIPFGIGLVLLLAGYIPVILGGGANLNLNGGSTRANTYAIFGGALALASLLGLGGLVLARFRSQVALLALAAALPFVLNGAAQQVWNQNETRIAWRQEQTFWHNLFLVIPNLRSDAILVVVSQESYPAQPFARLTIAVEWEVMQGLRVLYNNPVLQGTLFFPGFDRGGSRETRFEPDGVHGYDLALIPYNRAVIVIYTPVNGVIKVVHDPTQELNLAFQVQGYNPDPYILPDPPAKTPFRYLVH